jgi:hypothetical protein
VTLWKEVEEEKKIYFFCDKPTNAHLWIRSITYDYSPAECFSHSLDHHRGDITTVHQCTDNCTIKYDKFFPFMWPCIVTNFLIIKPTRCTNFFRSCDRASWQISL